MNVQDILHCLHISRLYLFSFSRGCLQTDTISQLYYNNREVRAVGNSCHFLLLRWWGSLSTRPYRLFCLLLLILPSRDSTVLDFTVTELHIGCYTRVSLTQDSHCKRLQLYKPAAVSLEQNTTTDNSRFPTVPSVSVIRAHNPTYNFPLIYV